MIIKSIEHISAMKIFESGPMMETRISSLLKLEKFNGFTGTGLAQAIKTLPVANSEKSGTKIEPTGSICGIGLSVNLPISLAVLSPRRKAI